ncbi:hypothetical protein [Bacillus suaedaesalsae]|uniref:Uncharacterized protein n=1 Tax=Bacillus suaedaesalsae TaxID=2810349 RepID=A0ABS2DIJ3_9BACI|nr:hypothetical protein [Bacillus suaedaesalsae]MBM6618269.1 hypothetical protein [Bacillus suaedaesalsae]
MRKGQKGMTWTLTLLGAGAVAYGVTKSMKNKSKSNLNEEELLPPSPDVPKIF